MIKKMFFSVTSHFPTCQAALRGKQAIPTRFQEDLMEQDGQAGDMQGGLLLLPDLNRLLALVVVLLHGGLVHQAARSRLPLCSLSQHLVVPVRTTRNHIISKREAADLVMKSICSALACSLRAATWRKRTPVVTFLKKKSLRFPKNAIMQNAI